MFRPATAKAAPIAGVVMVLAMLASSVAATEQRPLTGAEIRARLTGNTVVGTWSGRSYRQFFNKSGTTIYQQSGAPESRGRWRVDGDRYCSQWGARGGWSCYGVLDGGPNAILWLEPSSRRRHTARIEAGHRLGG